MAIPATAELLQSRLYLVPERMETDELVRAVRTILLEIYTPQQAARWIDLHAAVAPLDMAAKALRLRGVAEDGWGHGAHDVDLDPCRSRVSLDHTDECDGTADSAAGSGGGRPAALDVGRSTSLPQVQRDLRPRRQLERGSRLVRRVADPVGDPPRGPAARAAQIVSQGDALDDLGAVEVIAAALRGLLACDQSSEVQTILLETVHRLGGEVARASESDGDAIPVDVSLGVGDPLLASPSPAASPRTVQHLRSHLPGLVEDARRAVTRLDRHGRLADEAERDALTGLINRRGYDRLAGRLGAGDALILLDLDGFKAVNDTYGHLIGDQVLRAFGVVLGEQVRLREHAIRFGGDEFLVVLQGASEATCERFLQRLRSAWRQRRGLPIAFSAGSALITGRLDRALEAADRALYASKRDRKAHLPDATGAVIDAP